MPRPRSRSPRSPELAALGRAIQQVISETAGMTIEAVAWDSGLDVKQTGTYVRGLGNPTFVTLLRLCTGLHISLGELMRRVDAQLDRES